MNGKYSNESSLGTNILRDLRNPSKPIKSRDDVEKLYESRVWISLRTLDDIIDQANFIVNSLPENRTLTGAIVSMKFYIVTWCTISDILAKLINEVFELGIDDHDIKFMMILRNEHIKNSDLPEVLNRHKENLHHTEFTKSRNDIIHRGILNSQEISGFRNRIAYLKFIDLVQFFPNEDNEELVLNDLNSFLIKTKAEFEKHLEGTENMLDEMIDVLETHYKLKRLAKIQTQ